MPGVVSRAAAFALVRWCTAERRLRRTTDRVSRALAGLVWASSTPEERTRVGLALHDALEHNYRRASSGLHAWEERWFEQVLPPPPARVLVGAAGSGREVLALLERGYEVDAFEPAPRAHADLVRNVTHSSRVWQLTYQQLSSAVLEARAHRLGLRNYDVVLLGWGSLACVLDHGERTALLRACDLVCPRGPILASFIAESKTTRRGLGRAGRTAAHLLGSTLPQDVTLLIGAGFIRPLSQRDAEQLGDSVGRRTLWGETAFAHATWVPAIAPS